MKNLGVEYPTQSPEVRRKLHTKYVYNDVYFENRWELSIYIYCSDHMIHCIYQPNIKFQYIYNEKIHYYHPDFIINNKIYEIKGSQFIKDDGTYRNPYDKSGNQDELYEAKHQCMIKNNINIISDNEIKPFLQYMKNKYGKKWYLAYRRD